MTEGNFSAQDASLLRKLDGFTPDVVLDVGANIGESVDRFKRMWANCRVVCFEPRIDAFTQLKKNTEQYGASVVHFNVALGNKIGVETIHEVTDNAGFGGSSSLLRHRELPDKHTSKNIDIHINKLDYVLPQILYKGKNVFMKIDVEGYAKYVIDGAKEVLGFVTACLIEVNIADKYELDQTTPDDIERRMLALGFTCHGPTRRVEREQDGEKIQLWRDELWVRG